MASMNNIIFTKIRYNQSLNNDKVKLLNELKSIEKRLDYIKNNCDHVAVCLGINTESATSVCECLFCREVDPNTNYKKIDASNYKVELYGHGELAVDREERMLELQMIAMNLSNANLSLTNEELIDSINRIIKDNIESYKQNIKKI